MSQAHGNSFHLGQTGAGPNPSSQDAVREITEVPLPVDPQPAMLTAAGTWAGGMPVFGSDRPTEIVYPCGGMMGR